MLVFVGHLDITIMADRRPDAFDLSPLELLEQLEEQLESGELTLDDAIQLIKDFNASNTAPRRSTRK